MAKVSNIPTAGDLKINYKDPGGNGGQGAVARANATNAAIYANAQNAITYQRDLQNYAAGELEDELVRDIKTKQNEQQYSSMMQQRDIQISGQLEAYNRNSESIADQLKLNRQAAIKAGSENQAIFEDRIDQEGFKNQTLNFNRDKDLITSQNQYNKAEQARVNSQNRYNQATNTAEFNSNSKIQSLNFNTSERERQLFDSVDASRAQRDAITRKSTRDASSAQYSIDSTNREEDRFASKNEYEYKALERQQDILDSKATYDYDAVGRDEDRFLSQNAFEYDALEREKTRFDAGKDFEKASLGRDKSRYDSAKDYESEALTREKDRADSQSNYDYIALERAKGRFDSQKDFEKSMALNNFENVRAERMFQKQSRMLEAITQRGQSLSRGTRGRSASKGLQAISAMAGMDITKLTDSIYRADTTYKLQDTRYTDQKNENTKEYDAKRARSLARDTERQTEYDAKGTRITDEKLEYETDNTAKTDRITDQKLKYKKEYNKKRTRSTDIKTEMTTEYGAKQTRIQDTQTEQTDEIDKRKTRNLKVGSETAKEFQKKRARTQKTLNQTQSELQAQFDVSVNKEDNARKSYNKNKQRNTDLKKEQAGNLQLTLNDAFISRNAAKSDAAQQKKFIAQSLGLNERIFDMDREAIGRSMLSAMSSFETGEDNIWLRKYEADMKAYNSRMMKPMFTDAPEEPFKIPKFETIPPARPLEVPRGAVAPRPEAPKQSGLSKILSIGGMVVGALAAPLTAGGSLWAAAAVGAAGAGLSGTSAFV